MKKLLIVICAFLLILAPMSVMAKNSGKGKDKGPSPNESAYEHASDNAKFKRGDDWQGGNGKDKDDDDLESEDDEDNGKRNKEQDQKREKKKKGKKSDDQSYFSPLSLPDFFILFVPSSSDSTSSDWSSLFLPFFFSFFE